MYNQFEIPKLTGEEKVKFYKYIIKRNIERGLISFITLIIFSFALLLYYTYISQKYLENTYIYIAIVFSILITLGTIYYFVLKYYKSHEGNQTLRLFSIISYSIDIPILLSGALISALLNDSVIFFIIIIIVAIIPIVPIHIVISQFSIAAVFYLILTYILNNLTYNLIASTLIITFSAIFIGISLFYNTRKVFYIYEEFRKQHKLLQEYNNQLKQDSYSDSLTGVNNRRRIEDLLKIYWKKCKANNATLSLIFLDIDNFKNYNDYYGHLEGDECLKKVSKTINDLCLTLAEEYACSMGRYGGEEFIIILPYAEKHVAKEFATQICKKIERLEIPHATTQANSKYVTISCGTTSMIPNDSRRLLYMLDTADSALYYVKQNGKNNAKHYDDLPIEYFESKY